MIQELNVHIEQVHTWFQDEMRIGQRGVIQVVVKTAIEQCLEKAGRGLLRVLL